MHAEQTDIGTDTRRRWFSWECTGDLSDRDRRNHRRFKRWLMAWTFGFAFFLVLLSKDGLVTAPALRWTMALIPDVLGVLAVASYVRFLRHADELVRKIHLESIALGFGAGLVFVLGYRLASLTGAPELDGAYVAAIMLFAAGIGQWLGMRRYR